MSGIELEWEKDASGYRIDAALPSSPVPNSIIGHSPRSARIVRLGGRTVSYRPMEQFDRLFVEFSKLRTASDLQRFAHDYGPLTDKGKGSLGDSVDDVLWHANHMRQLRAQTDNPSDHWIFNGPTGVIGRLDVCLVLDGKSKRSRLQFKAPDLLTALWLQFGQEISRGTETPTCAHCGTLFVAGPGADRRRGAKFCSPECKRTYFSLLRSSGAGS